MKFNNRVKELRMVKASELQAHPKNWRKHPESQLKALRGLLSEVGFAGAELARELEDGTLQLIDGHARASVAGDEEVPVLVLDVDEAEAAKILATYDPIGGMANANKETLAVLLSEIETDNDAIGELLSKMMPETVLPAEAIDLPEVEYQLPEKVVRMVQLFFDDETIKEFNSLCDQLRAKTKLQAATELVLHALRCANENNQD